MHICISIIITIISSHVGRPLSPLIKKPHTFREFTKGGIAKGGLAIRHAFNVNINNRT